MKRVSVIVFLLLAACSNKNSLTDKMIYDLTADSCKYWIRYHKDPLKTYKQGFCINKDGYFIRYYYPRKSDGKIRAINDDPISFYTKPVWKILNDSTIMFGEGDSSRIILLDSNNLILQNLRFKDSFLKLYREQDQNTKPQKYIDTIKRNEFPRL